MSSLTHAQLLAAARAFCDSFAQKRPIEEILLHFASPPASSTGTSAAATSPSPTSSTADEGKTSHNRGGSEILVHEHGLPQLAPFLGQDFRGLAGARQYFETVGACLSYEDMRFMEFVADTAAGGEGDENENEGEDVDVGKGGKVAVRGKARFTWKDTGQSWDETFLYILCFDARAKLKTYEVWADSGAAYLARRGELGGSTREREEPK
ncbi:transcription elongation factor S-II [Nemania sp. FL0031]|nr:transcription elongation factor S-II [Nemania sp. FL0031]